MSIQQDAELLQLLREEVQERAEHLHEGAAALAEGPIAPEAAAVMSREGHTIKGTARVMGFTAMSAAGSALEVVWKELADGRRDPTPQLAGSLGAVADELLPALDGDPEHGTHELRSATARLLGPQDEVADRPDEAAGRDDPSDDGSGDDDPGGGGGAPLDLAGADSRADPAEPAGDPAPPEARLDQPKRTYDWYDHGPETPDAERPDPVVLFVEEPLVPPTSLDRDRDNLGGLLGGLEGWATDEYDTVQVAGLYQVINTIAGAGTEVDDLQGRLLGLADHLADVRDALEDLQHLSAAINAVAATVLAARDRALGLAEIPLAEITGSFDQLVQYVARKEGMEVRTVIVGDQVPVDRNVLDSIADPIRQLLVNSLAHGIEPPEVRVKQGKPSTATVTLQAERQDNTLEIVVSDDGRGVDWDAVRLTAERRGLLPPENGDNQEALQSLLFSPGFTTVAADTPLVEDGSGLTVVFDAVDRLHGTVHLESSPGSGTSIRITVPASTILQDAVLVRAADYVWGVAAPAVVETMSADPSAVLVVAGKAHIVWRGSQIPLVPFAAAVGLSHHDEAKEIFILASPSGAVALSVPEVLGRREVASKPLSPLLTSAPHLTSAALLGGGDVVVLVDPGRLAERARHLPPSEEGRPVVLIVDDSQGVRQVVAATLAAAGFDTMSAGSAADGLELMEERSFDAVVVDFAMPGSDGVELVGEVRRRHGSMPVVMLSAVATTDDQARAAEAGVDRYFDKTDISEGALPEALRSLVAERRIAMEMAS